MTTPHTPLAPASSSLCGAADSLRHTLSDAADSVKSAEQRWSHRADQLGDQLSNRAQHLARQSLDLAANASAKAQDSWTHYTQASHAYVAKQPLRSVLMAAALGAGLALWLAANRKR
jgi:ElaB/YqjD/DUF883 family membrane-anchored ribosome-binding protein|eukprot:gene30574-52742_t